MSEKIKFNRKALIIVGLALVPLGVLVMGSLKKACDAESVSCPCKSS